MKTTKGLLAAMLLVMISISCSQESQVPRATEPAPEATGALNILFEDGEGSGFTEDDKQLIGDIIVQSAKKVRTLLPTLPDKIDVTAIIIDRNIDIVGGVTGRAEAPGKVRIEFSRLFPGGISAAARTALSSSIFHELHHLDRGWTIQENKFGKGIPIAAVNEGLASVFSEEYTDEYFEEASSYPEGAAKWLEEILALPEDASYSDWVSGVHPDGRDAIGYRVGRYIIHQATANSGKDVLALSKLSPDEILQLAVGNSIEIVQ